MNNLVILWDHDDFNKAHWKGVGFIVDLQGDMPPLLGLYFLDVAAGRRVFEQMRAAVGSEDSEERLRISIVEGDIKRQEPGYTIQIGPSLDRVIEDAASQARDNQMISSISRVHRMNPPGGKSKSLEMFKASYAKHKRFGLVPMEMANSQMKPHVDLVIAKKTIYLRHVSEIVTANDPDRIVLKDRPARTAWN